MELTRDQKKVIEYMRKPGAALLFDIRQQKCRVNDKTYSRAFSDKLQKMDLICGTGLIIKGSSFFELTELGKTIDIN